MALNTNNQDVIEGKTFLNADLHKTHDLYEDNQNEWAFLNAMYDGIRMIVELGLIGAHEREDVESYSRRISELFGLNYSRAVVDLVTFYLFKKEPTRTLPDALANDSAWAAFLSDCNLYGDSFADFMADRGRWAAVQGTMGFLIDKPPMAAENKAQERDLGIYPYIASYFPSSILDWYYERDATGRPRLTFLKLKDDDDTYRIWYPDRWETWIQATDEDGTPLGDEAEATLLASGVNKLGEIPFVWLHNVRGRDWPIGVSDIHEIGRIDLSIIRDLSQLSEIVGYNAFPMLLAPALEDGEAPLDEVGSTAILEFDPENPQAKPEWLTPAAEGVIKAILLVIEQKGREIYRIANAGGLQQVDTATVAKSGTALSAEFQQLNAKIVQKAVNVEKAENQILYFWLRWQGMDELIPESKIERSRDYDVHNLAQDLADAMTAKTIVRSETFRQEVEKSVARATLPQLEDDVMQKIEDEIEEPPEEIGFEELPGQAPGAPRPGSDEETADFMNNEPVEEGEQDA